MRNDPELMNQNIIEECGDRYELLNSYEALTSPLLLRCKTCGKTFGRDYNHLIYRGQQKCPHCKPYKKTPEFFKKQFYDLEPTDYVLLGEYTLDSKPILMKHLKCGHEFMLAPNKFFQGRRCPRCGMASRRLKTHEWFVQQVAEQPDAEYYELLSEYNGYHNYVTFLHKDCGHEFQVFPGNFIKTNGTRCPFCAKNRTKTDEEYIGFIKEEFGEESEDYELLKIDRRKNPSAVYFKFRHFCGYEYGVHSGALFYQHQRCPECARKRADSLGVQNVEGYLKKHGFVYQREYSFKDCRGQRTEARPNGIPLRFDFAILNKDSSLRCLIEYDGEQHSQKGNGWYSEDVVLNDKRKNEYCEINNIKLLRISYENDSEIESILEEFLNEERYKSTDDI